MKAKLTPNEKRVARFLGGKPDSTPVAVYAINVAGKKLTVEEFEATYNWLDGQMEVVVSSEGMTADEFLDGYFMSKDEANALISPVPRAQIYCGNGNGDLGEDEVNQVQIVIGAKVYPLFDLLKPELVVSTEECDPSPTMSGELEVLTDRIRDMEHLVTLLNRSHGTKNPKPWVQAKHNPFDYLLDAKDWTGKDPWGKPLDIESLSVLSDDEGTLWFKSVQHKGREYTLRIS